MDYNTTVNLPKTDFSMKGNLPSKEPGILEKWSALDVYGTLLKRDQDKPLFVLHDGPPYANGDIHLGHALNKSLKDFVVRYKSMRGFNTPFIPGWDTHGLPTELKVIKEKKIRKDTVGIVPYRKTCKEVAEKYHQIQSKSFERLGCRADYAHPYITFTGDYEAEQIRVFGEMALRGCVYRGLKPVFWCPDCGTALAEAEIEYAEDPCVTVFVKFPAVKIPDSLAALAEGKRLSFVIWTTTPWTLPGNLAISLNPSFEYAVVAVEGEAYVIAKELVEGVMKECGVEEYAVLGTVKGEELEYAVCRHPFLERDSLVIVGQHVTLEAGTGCVHTAPGFGMDDYIVCSKYPSLPIVVPVDDRGVQTAEAGQFAGLTYDKSNVAIVDYLRENGYLLGEKKIKHQYPHCWRCHKPILMRATRQWFVSVDKFKEAAIEAAGTATWYPRWGYDRIVKMIADRNDWCISRQRAWGVPIPMVICEECGEPIIDRKFFEAVASVFEKEDSNAWYERSAEEWMALAGLSACAHCGSTKFRKEQDIMDVWFDSGSSHTAVFAHRPECGSAPYDLYFEGSDQYRGWFQSSLLTSVASGKGSPYKAVLSHGYVVDQNGKKMSKSLGNGIDPADLFKQNGADIVRLWTAYSDYTVDIRAGKDIFAKVAEIYKKFRNTVRFALGNLYDFNPETDFVPYAEMEEIDRFALYNLAAFIEKATDFYDRYVFHLYVHELDRFCRIDLSQNYFDIIKDRLYTAAAGSKERRSAQSVLWHVANVLARTVAPVLCFTAEEIWTYLAKPEKEAQDSIHFCSWPTACAEWKNEALNEKWQKILAYKAEVLRVCEAKKAELGCSNAMQMEVQVFADETHNALELQKEIALVCMAARLTVLPYGEATADAVAGEAEGLSVAVQKTEAQKCERCWCYSETVGAHAEHPTLCEKCRKALNIE